MTTRILQYSYGGEHPSGIDSYLLSAYRGVDRRRVQFDFLYRYGCPLSPQQRAEVEALGARVFALDVEEHRHPVLRQWQELVRLWRFFRRYRYGVVEINMTALFMILSAATLARAHGVRRVIVHAHDALPHEARAKRVLKTLFRPVLDLVATDFWACSAGAAAYLFGARRARSGAWELVVNGIETARFAYDAQARGRVRSELGLTDQLLVGIVGRMTPQKNHLFALDIIAEARRSGRDVRLLVVGDGPLRPRIDARIAELDLIDAVILAGVRQDMPAVLSAMDVLLQPSLHEGFPVVGLEAQANGLPCVVSDAWPGESDLTGTMTICKLAAAPASWWHAMDSLKHPPRDAAHHAVAARRYTASGTASTLGELYARWM